MQTLPRSLKIGVLRGGPSLQYDTSLKSGADVVSELSEEHNVIDIFISKDGKWHMQGVERAPEKILKNVDVVYNAMHGKFGEDGGVQDVLNHHGVKYTGSGKFESAIANNKWMTKERAIKAGIKTPVAFLVRREDKLSVKAKEIFESVPHPLIVKPACEGGTLGVYVVHSYVELVSALEHILVNHGSAVVEEYIDGIQTSCLVTDNFRGQETYAFPPTSILKLEEKKSVEEISKKIHRLLGLSDYSKSDFIVSPKRGVYFLEVNTTPKIHKKSELAKSIESVGVSIKDFFHHIIHLAFYKTGAWL